MKLSWGPFLSEFIIIAEIKHSTLISFIHIHTQHNTGLKKKYKLFQVKHKSNVWLQSWNKAIAVVTKKISDSEDQRDVLASEMQEGWTTVDALYHGTIRDPTPKWQKSSNMWPPRPQQPCSVRGNLVALKDQRRITLIFLQRNQRPKLFQRSV